MTNKIVSSATAGQALCSASFIQYCPFAASASEADGDARARIGAILHSTSEGAVVQWRSTARAAALFQLFLSFVGRADVRDGQADRSSRVSVYLFGELLDDFGSRMSRLGGD